MSLFGQQRVLVVIPAYNEAVMIGQVVGNARRTLSGADVLVIDDGSLDDTAQEATKAGAQVVRHPFNLGIGATVQTGLKFAQTQGYDVILRMDGDGQHDGADFLALYEPVRNQEADVVFGSRFLDGCEPVQISTMRRLGIFYFACVISLLTRQRATDTTSGLCCLNRRAVETLAAYMPQDYPEVEGRLILHKAGLRVLEIPTQMRERQGGQSSIDSWRSIYYAFKVSLAVLTTVLKEIPDQSKEDS